MEFWGIEVKAGEPFKVELHEKRALHLSQACIGEVEKESSESICLFANINGKTFVLGTLNTEKLPQQTFDLVFDKTFELFHKWKNGSVFFHGYTADNEAPDHPIKDYNDSDYDKSSSDEDIPAIAPNGPAIEVKQERPKVSAGKDSTAGKQKVKIVEPEKDVSSEDSDDSSDDDDDDETSSEDEPKVSSGKDSAAGKQKMKIMEPKKDLSSEDGDDDTTSSEDEPKVSARKDSAAGEQKAKIVEPKNDASSEDDADSSDDEENKSASDEDSDEDEVTPVQVKSSKKRASVSASKTAVSQKKAKLSTQKTDGKKSSVHVDTPYPSKQAGKAPANKPSQQTPKTEGSHSCKPCKRTFKSEGALESHNKAKHSGGK